MIPTLTANSLKPFFSRSTTITTNAPPPKDNTLYDILKSSVTHSSISKFAITGSMLGWFSGQSWEMGLAGATVGTLRDLVPILFNELPDDIKELAKQTANIGLTTLGTYAIYNSIPNSWVRNIFNCIPLSLKRFPATLTTFANSPISTPETPRTLEAALKEALKFISPLISTSIPIAKTILANIGFPDVRKFTVSTAGSYIGLESLKAVGEHRLVRPFADIVKEFANDRAQFIDKLFNVAVAISAIPLSTYLHKNPIAPIDLTKARDLSLPLQTRLFELVQHGGGHIVNALINKETYIRTAIIGLFFAAHTVANYNKPAEPIKEIDEAKEISLDDIYDLLEKMMAENQTAKASTALFPNRVDKLHAAIAPIKLKLDRAVKETHIENQTTYRNAILAVIDQEINALEIRLAPPPAGAPLLETKSTTLLRIYILEALDLKLEELSYQDNDKAHRGIAGQRARIKAVIRTTLEKKFETLTFIQTAIHDEFNRLDAPGDRAKKNSLRALIDLIDLNRERTYNTLYDL